MTGNDRWINDVSDRFDGEYDAVARAMLNGPVQGVQGAEAAMLKMSAAGLLEAGFVESNNGQTWTLRYALPESYR